MFLSLFFNKFVAMNCYRHIVCLLALVASSVSCVYDFQPDYQGQAGYVAIEGDILVGDTCRFDVRLSTDLEDKRNEGEPLSYTLRVESSDGVVYPLQDKYVDLTSADISQDYRLVVEVTAPFHRTYASRWASVQITPPIDSLVYDISEDRSTMDINVSTHSDGSLGYLRWIASETWEYHSATYALWFYAPAGTEYKGRTIETGAIITYEDDENVYWCWDSEERSDILTATTTTLSEDRLVNYTLYSLSNTEQKISYIYFVELTQTRLSEEGYRYWEKMRSNSTDVGGLFSPEPSELRGNLVNVDDPEELVLGYVGVATASRARMFIESYKLNFGYWRGPLYGDFAIPWQLYESYYWSGYRVGYREDLNDDGSGGTYYWFPGECVDCTRIGGGTKERPSWWINNDK